MEVIRKSHCQTGRLNAAERRDAQERRSDRAIEKVIDDFFNAEQYQPIRPHAGV